MTNSKNSKINKNFFGSSFKVLAVLGLVTVFSLITYAQEIKNDNLAVNISYNDSINKSLKIGASDYKKIENAESLELSGNKLESLPAYIFKMQSIENLTVKSNNLIDISIEIRKLYNLRILDLSQTSVQNIPEEISQLRQLKEIHLPYSIWAYRIDEVKKLTRAEIILE